MLYDGVRQVLLFVGAVVACAAIVVLIMVCDERGKCHNGECILTSLIRHGVSVSFDDRIKTRGAMLRAILGPDRFRAVCRIGVRSDSAFGDEYQIGSFAVFDNLKQISLVDSQVSNVVIDDIARCKWIWFVRVGNVHGMDLDLGALGGAPSLKCLDIHDMHLSSRDIIGIAKAKKLYFLQLRSTDIADRDADTLARMPRLSTLDISGTNVTFKGVCELLKSTSIRSLDMNRVAVDDSELAELERRRGSIELRLFH